MQSQAERDAALAAQAPVDNTINSRDPHEIVVQTEDGRVIDFESRKGFGAQSQKLAWADKEPGYHYYWFNDEPGRVAMAREAGYTPVLDRDRKPVTRVVDKTTGMLAYLHRVPQAWYEEDLKVAQRAADEKDAAILAGAAPDPNGRAEKVGNQYGSIKMSRRPNG